MIIFIVILALVVLIIAGVVAESRKQKAFKCRFPPISDDEFMARCSPGASRRVALRVRRIVADQLGVEYERVYPSSRFVQDLLGE